MKLRSLGIRKSGIPVSTKRTTTLQSEPDRFDLFLLAEKSRDGKPDGGGRGILFRPFSSKSRQNLHIGIIACVYAGVKHIHGLGRSFCGFSNSLEFQAKRYHWYQCYLAGQIAELNATAFFSRISDRGQVG
jgi:hypothetical protein